MKISVIIPSYKPQNYIWECLDSLKNQTFSKSDFEIILVLNGCNEPYKTQVDNYIEKNLQGYNVNFIQTNQGGVSNARNIALDVAQGEYITFIDDDDLISDNYLQGLYDKIVDGVVVVSNVKTFLQDYKSEKLGEDYLSRAYNKYSSTQVSSIFKLRSFLSSSCCKLISREIILNRRFNVNFKIGEDSLFMALVSDKINKIYLADSNVIYYRRLRHGSASRINVGIRIRSQNFFKECWQYFLIYIKKPFEYNFLFFVSRFVAIFIKNIKFILGK